MLETLSTAHLIFLLPAWGVALCVKQIASRSGAFGTGALMIIGTTVHELLHFVVGFLMNAKPVDISLWPKKTESGYRLGYVGFANIRWYNAVFVAMAPLLGLLAILLFVDYRLAQQLPYQFKTSDLFAWLCMGQVMLSSWPSPQDFKVALASWPIFVVIGYWFWPGSFF